MPADGARGSARAAGARGGLQLPGGVAALAAALGLAVLVGAPGCTRERSGDDVEPAPASRRVRCAPLVAADSEDSIEVRGTMAPPFGKDAQIASQVAGRVLAVRVREGERVRAGQELARVDDGTLLDQAHQADAVVARARAESELARTTETRIRRVFERGIAARQELDDAVARLATAQAVEAETRAASAITRRQLARAILRSPLDGVVLKVFRKAGELVDGTPGTPIVEVGDPAVLELVATVAAAELVQMRAGAPARVSVPALPGQVFPARVSLVSPTVERASGLGTVRVRLDPTSAPRPPIGVAAVAEVGVGRTRRVLWAPAVALHAPTGAEAELSVCGSDGHAHAVRVSVGRASAGRVEIRAVLAATDAASPPPGAPLAAGSAVVIEPALGVEDGAAIERAR